MIRRLWLTIVGFLSSAILAVGLLIFVGVWSLLATLVAQGAATSPAVAAWAAAHPLLEPVVRALGFHQAFTSYVFLGCVFVLVLSTARCAWRRTRVAIAMSRALRSALRADEQSLSGAHDLEIGSDPDLSKAEALSVVSRELRLRGIKVTRRGDLLVATSRPWSVWGSTLFHWSLVALIVAVLAGQLLRSEGTMAVAVGETKPDEPTSYVSVAAGPWRDWSAVSRGIRVDSFEPDYKTGGVDRGAVPTVSVLNGAGSVVVTQRVYPNNMLHAGSLAISAPACGLSVSLALLGPDGAESGRLIQHVDFSQSATEGTVPVRSVSRRDAAGNVTMRMSVTVPLDRSGQAFGEWIPKQPSARVLVTSGQGAVLLDRVLRPTEQVALPGGGAVRLLGVGWYSRLSVVDDPSIPFIYAAMVLAMAGLAMTLLLRQQLLVATMIEGAEGPVLLMRFRLWRNTSTSRVEIEEALTRALRADEKGGTS